MGTKITVYGGAAQVGGNQILLEDKMGNIMLDFGMNFAEQGRYFDEFLRPDAKRGLYDYLYFNFIPPLKGIYREDMEMEDLWEKIKNRNLDLYRDLNLDAVFISHAHADHFAYLSFINETVPIYSSFTTALIMKAVQDTSTISDVCYYKEYQKTNDGDYHLGDLGLKHPSRANYYIKNLLPHKIADRDIEYYNYSEFMSKSPTASSIIEDCLEAKSMLAEEKYKFWHVDHSIPGATACAFDTEGGWVVYTGDFRMHGKNRNKTRIFMEEVAKLEPELFICECTHVDKEISVSEEDIKNNVLEVVQKAKGRLVIADFAPRNIERLEAFLAVAEYADRDLVITEKDFYLLKALYIAKEIDWDPLLNERIKLYYKLSLSRSQWQKDVLRESFSKIIKSTELKQNPGDYILCFSYYDFGELPKIEPYNAVYIYSSSEAYDEEMLLDHQKVENWIKFFNMDLYGGLGNIKDRRFHCSGHIDEKGMIEIIETIKPKKILPIHGENRQFFDRFKDKFQVIWPEKRGYMVEL